GQLQGIGRDPRPQRLEHLGRSAEEAVGRHQAADALMRSLKVVVVDEMADAGAGIGQVHKDGGLDALAPQRAPEAFDLAQGLRPPWRGDHLADAAFVQLLAEGALAAPGDILAAVVGEDLLGPAVAGQRGAEYLQDQGRRLTGVQAVADQKAAVVVQEGDQIDTAVLPLQRSSILMPSFETNSSDLARQQSLDPADGSARVRE